jgi:hypothetical protein
MSRKCSKPSASIRSREQLLASMSRSRIARWPLALQSGYICPACHAARNLGRLQSTASSLRDSSSTVADDATPPSQSGGFLSPRHARILASYNLQQPGPSKKPTNRAISDDSKESTDPETSHTSSSTSKLRTRRNKGRTASPSNGKGSANSTQNDSAPSASTGQAHRLSSNNAQSSAVSTQPLNAKQGVTVSSGKSRSDSSDPHQASTSSLVYTKKEQRERTAEQGNQIPPEPQISKYITPVVRKYRSFSIRGLVRKIETLPPVQPDPARSPAPARRKERIIREREDAEPQSAPKEPVQESIETYGPAPIDHSTTDPVFERAKAIWEALKSGPKSKGRRRRNFETSPATIAAFYARDLKPNNGRDLLHLCAI